MKFATAYNAKTVALLISLRFRNSLIECETGSDVVFLVGCEPDVQRIPGHSWVLAENSPVFRAMFGGGGGGGGIDKKQERSVSVSMTNSAGVVGMANSVAAAGARKPRKTTVAVSDVDGRAFDILLR